MDAGNTRGPVRQEMSGSIAQAAELLATLAARYQRVAVTGRPGVGKSLVARQSGLAVTALDDYVVSMPWDRQPKWLAQNFDAGRPWVIEGVVVARGLRHGLAADAVLVLKGAPLRPHLLPGALKLGDQVMRWIDEAMRSRPDVDFYMWTVQERKYG